MVCSQMAVRWLLYAELQLRHLLAKRADLLAEFVKCLGQLRAEWTCIALHFRIDDLSTKALLSTTADNIQRNAR